MRMIHTVHPGPDNTVHVQNEVLTGFSVLRGQHHVHSLKGYQNWLNRVKIDKENVVTVIGVCACGLKPGDAKDHEGNVTHDDCFEKDEPATNRCHDTYA